MPFTVVVLPPLTKMELSREKVVFIRPLLYARKKKLKGPLKAVRFLLLNQLVLIVAKPKGKVSRIVNYFYHRFPEARNNFLTMLSNQEQLELWVKEMTKR